MFMFNIIRLTALTSINNSVTIQALPYARTSDKLHQDQATSVAVVGESNNFETSVCTALQSKL